MKRWLRRILLALSTILCLASFYLLVASFFVGMDLFRFGDHSVNVVGATSGLCFVSLENGPGIDAAIKNRDIPAGGQYYLQVRRSDARYFDRDRLWLKVLVGFEVRNRVVSRNPSPPVTERALAIPLWCMIVVTGAWPARLLRRRLQRRRREQKGHCPICGYDLRATPDRCPECGTVAAPIAQRV